MGGGGRLERIRGQEGRQGGVLAEPQACGGRYDRSITGQRGKTRLPRVVTKWEAWQRPGRGTPVPCQAVGGSMGHLGMDTNGRGGIAVLQERITPL
jgi:hypothetical protein